MKNKWYKNWKLWLGAGLVLASIAIYFFEYLAFHDRKTIAVWVLNDLAFVPISVLLVTLILDQLLHSREKEARLDKNNMVIGAFFSQVGTNLLRILANHDPDSENLAKEFAVRPVWTDKDFTAVKAVLSKHKFQVNMNQETFTQLSNSLCKEREFMIRLLENQTLLEHEVFTDLLWASFHLADELSLRPGFANLPEPDVQHLALDAHRAYVALVGQWVDYLMHLKKAYPYLFSLAVRMNPFNKEASPVIVK